MVNLLKTLPEADDLEIALKFHPKEIACWTKANGQWYFLVEYKEGFSSLLPHEYVLSKPNLNSLLPEFFNKIKKIKFHDSSGI